MIKDPGVRPFLINSIRVILLWLVIVLAVPSCQDGHWADVIRAPALGRSAHSSVQEGNVTVRDGEEVQVTYRTPYQSPPQLRLVGFVQSGFVGVPCRLANFKLVKQEATGFKIQSDHPEQHLGSWATVQWRAEGIEVTDKLAAATTQGEKLSAWVERLGGHATLEPTLPGKPVTSIDLHDTRINDADLEFLEGITSLHSLNLYGTGISDAGLTHLAGLTRLQILQLNFTAVTDAGLQSLKHLTNLKELGLNRTHITDEGLSTLTALTNLQKLAVSGPRITDRGLQSLKHLSDLKLLVLSQTKVTPAGIEDLQRARPRLKIIR